MSVPSDRSTAKLLIACQCLVGESPVWDQLRAGLWWVDIRAPAIHFHMPESSELRTWKMPSAAGFVALCEDGMLVVGLASGIKRFDPSNGSLLDLIDPLEGRTNMRLNEGRVDPMGRLWFGIMHDRGEIASGALLRWLPSREIETLRKGLFIPNGLSFDNNGANVTFTDSADGRFLRLGQTTLQDHVLLTSDAASGVPDGAAQDEEDHIWLARFGGGCVLRIDPDGQIVHRINVPAPNVTAVTFGGADRRDLFITTARRGLSAQELLRWPLSGAVFKWHAAISGRQEGRLV